MIRKRKKALIVEPLEGKQLLSTLHSTLVHPTAQVHAANQNFSLAGTVRSPVNTIQTFVANGQNYGSFRFTGRLKAMGAVSGAFVAAIDSTQQVMSSGMIRFTNKRGSVDLALTPAPNDTSSYLFKVASGTGAYTAANGSGRIQTSGYSKNLTVVSFSVVMNPT